MKRTTLALAAATGGMLHAEHLGFSRLPSSGSCEGYVVATGATTVGDVLWSGLKRRERALEKVMRSYNDDATLLCDICRQACFVRPSPRSKDGDDKGGAPPCAGRAWSTRASTAWRGACASPWPTPGSRSLAHEALAHGHADIGALHPLVRAPQAFRNATGLARRPRALRAFEQPPRRAADMGRSGSNAATVKVRTREASITAPRSYTSFPRSCTSFSGLALVQIEVA